MVVLIVLPLTACEVQALAAMDGVRSRRMTSNWMALNNAERPQSSVERTMPKETD